MTSNIRLVSSRLTQPRPLPALRSTGVPFNFSQDERLDIVPSEPSPPPPPTSNVEEVYEDPLNYDAMAPSQERLIQELPPEDSSVSIRELPSFAEGIQADEPSVVPLGDIVDATPRHLNEEKINALFESLRRRAVNGSTKPDPAPQQGSDTLYFERTGFFARKHRRDLRKLPIDEYAQAMLKFKDAGVAYSVQNTFHNFALIVQGYLSGLSLGKAVFAIHFASEKILLESYRPFSLPVHIAFVIAFSIACAAAYDRLAFYGFSWQGAIKTISHSGFLGAFLWTGALVSSLLCMQFDDRLSLKHENVLIYNSDLAFWRICCAVRAICAGAAWLLLALKPEGDELGDAIHRSVDIEMEAQKSAREQREQEDAATKKSVEKTGA